MTLAWHNDWHIRSVAEKRSDLQSYNRMQLKMRMWDFTLTVWETIGSPIIGGSSRGAEATPQLTCLIVVVHLWTVGLLRKEAAVS